MQPDSQVDLVHSCCSGSSSECSLHTPDMSVPVSVPPPQVRMSVFDTDHVHSAQAKHPAWSLPDSCLSNGSGPVAEAKQDEVYSNAANGSSNDVIWKGTTWDACPIWAACCAPLCCVTRKWRITRQAIDMEFGCCGSKADTMLMSHVRDISFAGNCCTRALCCGRATITIHGRDATHPQTKLTTQHAKPLYRKLKGAVQERHGGHPMAVAY